jgi:pyruvate/2-oxoglutarate dehydrogenase complex dihydrolipoamide acyltransferase (E2) component
MKAILKLPRLSTNMQEATIIDWYRQPGENFVAGEPIYAVETEKVTADVEAPCDGVLLEILLPKGQNVEVGESVCRIEKSK